MSTAVKRTVVDFIPEDKYGRFEEILAIAEKAKEVAPKAPRAPRAPLSIETKLKMAEGRKAKAQAALDALLAEQEAEDANE